MESMESGIHECGIRNPQTWNPEYTAWNPESRTLSDYMRAKCEFLDRMDFDAIFQQINLRYQ